MRALYNACDLTVLLSRREGMPNVLLESMACAVPVVATDVADNALLIAHGLTGYLVAPEDASAAASYVVRLLNHTALRHEMGRAARRRVSEEFTLRRAAENLEVIYQSWLAKKCSLA